MFTEDLSVFFDDQGGFAVTVTNGNGETFLAIFDNQTEALNAGNVVLDISQPSVLMSESDGALLVGALGINGKSYIIDRKHPDGTGLVRVYLVEAQASNPSKGSWR